VAGRKFFTRVLQQVPRPVEVTTDRAPAYLGVLDELLPAARHVTERYSNNRIEADHGRLKARLRAMRGLKHLATAAVIATDHAFVQNIRRGHDELAVDSSPALRLVAAFTDLARTI
jgi:IS6 family transposase